jgi:hypothetical protein
LLVSGLTLILVLFVVGKLGLISSLVNFGALVFLYYLLTGRSRELTIGEDA